MPTNAENFVKYSKRVAPEAQISGQNSKLWQFWGPYSHIFAPINVKFSTGEHPSAKFQVYRGNVASAGRKTHFWTTELNNTGMAEQFKSRL